MTELVKERIRQKNGYQVGWLEDGDHLKFHLFGREGHKGWTTEQFLEAGWTPVFVRTQDFHDVCDSCNCPIVWLTHKRTKKPAPIESFSHVMGNVRMLDDGTYEIVHPFDAERARGKGERLHVNHFATCPDSKKWKEHAEFVWNSPT